MFCYTFSIIFFKLGPTDAVSYEANVRKLLEAFKDPNVKPDTIELLMTLTAPNRRIEIKALTSAIDDYVLQTCPPLHQPTYVIIQVTLHYLQLALTFYIIIIIISYSFSTNWSCLWVKERVPHSVKIG